jgi:hypothetical protein
MSSRHEKEKRLRPRSNPYKRDHFVQAEYLRMPKKIEDLVDNTEKNFDDIYEASDEE